MTCTFKWQLPPTGTEYGVQSVAKPNLPPTFLVGIRISTYSGYNFAITSELLILYFVIAIYRTWISAYSVPVWYLNFWFPVIFRQCSGSECFSHFGPPRYFHQQSNEEKLISTHLWLLYDFLSFKNDVNVTTICTFIVEKAYALIFFGILKVTDEKSRICSSVADQGCLSRTRLFSIPDPHQWI